MDVSLIIKRFGEPKSHKIRLLVLTCFSLKVFSLMTSSKRLQILTNSAKNGSCKNIQTRCMRLLVDVYWPVLALG